MKKVQVVFGFDMETDIGSWTPYYEGFVKGTPKILNVLKKNDVTATFYFTGHSAQKHPEILVDVKKAGHEIGCHGLYHETIGDPLFEIPGIYPLLPEEIFPRLKLSTELVEKASGVKPVSFRAPRLWGSTPMLNALEKLKYKSDASYPMYFYKKQVEPYHPSKKDWTEKGDLKIVELPNFADLSMKSKDKYGRDMDQWPLFRTESADALLKHVDGYISFCNKKSLTPFLCFYLHPWEFYKMPEGAIHYGEGSVTPDPFIVKNCGEYAVKQLDLLIKKLQDRGADFLQAKQVKAS